MLLVPILLSVEAEKSSFGCVIWQSLVSFVVVVASWNLGQIEKW